MSRKKIKTLSASLLLIFLFTVFVLSDSKSSYLAPFIKTISNTQQNFDSGEEVKSTSVSVNETQSPEKQISGNSDYGTGAEGAETYRVVKVVDGDTVDVDLNGTTTRLRVIGIDTPETVDPRKPVQCFGLAASKKAKEILSGEFVTLIADESQGNTDKYSRLLRYVTLPDGSDYGFYMISQGYAHEYTYNIPYEKQGEYKQAEIDARDNGRGLWSSSTCSGNK